MAQEGIDATTAVSGDGKKKAQSKPQTFSKPAVENYIPESVLYNQLVELEKEIDAIINRKKFDILDLRNQIKTTRRTLRIFVSNVFSDPMAKIRDSAAAVDDTRDDPPFKPVETDSDDIVTPSWTLAIEGRLLDLPRSRKTQAATQKFSSFIKSVIVQLNHGAGEASQVSVVEWNKLSDPDSEFDGIEIKRKGNKDTPVKILIYLDRKPEAYRLAKPLADLLGIHTDTVSNIVMALWKYIKSRKLQDYEDKKHVDCDEELFKIFNQKRILLSNLPQMIRPYLLPPDPVVIDYVVRTDKEYSYSPTAYDVSIDTINLFAKQKSATLLLASTSAQHRDLAVLNKKIQKLTSDISNAQLKRDFLKGFVSDPVAFMERWIASQSRDLETILGEPWLDTSEISRSTLFTGENARNAIAHYLSQTSSTKLPSN